jgi:hypothetical protein
MALLNEQGWERICSHLFAQNYAIPRSMSRGDM